MAVGTAGAVLAAQPGHPLFGVFEVTDLAETSRNSGVWKPMANTRAVTDAAITSGAGTLTSSTAAFTTADVGRNVVVAGAGASGAPLTAMITARNSATSVALDFNASTTVSGAALTIGDSYTVDGTHPTVYSSALLTAAIDTSKVV